MGAGLKIIEAITDKIVVPKCSAVIVAAGASTRMGGVDKIVTDLAGKPMILRAAEAFQQNGGVQEIIVVTREELCGKVEQILKIGGITKLAKVVPGGATRLESVNKGLNWCSKKSKLVAIHDGARPMVSQRIITETIGKAAKLSAAAPAIPVTDTVRVVEDGIGVQTPERKKLYAFQTPQVFDKDLVHAAVISAIQKKLSVTDDCAAVEAMGGKIAVTQGEEENFKVTTRLDLAVANAICRRNDAK